MSRLAWLRRVVEAVVPGSVLWRARPSSPPTVYLTFDDGPHPEHTPAVLDVLRRFDVRATFFVTASLAERHPELVLQLVAEGHGVANHGFIHMSAQHLSTSGYVLNAEAGQRTLERIVRRPLPRLFRPPHGILRPRSFLALRRRGYQFVLWSQDSGDSHLGATAAGIVDRLDPAKLSAGDIVLLHDDTSAIARALPIVIERLQAAGFRLARIDRPARQPAVAAGSTKLGEPVADGGESCAG